MTQVISSREELYATVSGRCWWCSRYDPDWPESRRQEYGEDLSADTELHEIVQMERDLGDVPEWAQRIVATSLKLISPCGHHTFPKPFLDILSAIGNQTPPDFIHGCFVITRDRKLSMQDYCLCLDGWLAGAQPDAISAELDACGHRRIDWRNACRDLWDVLGERKEWKRIGVNILLHDLRHMIKDTVCSDDPELRLCPDQYLGDYQRQTKPEEGQFFQGMTFARYGESPRVAALRDRLEETKPKGLQPFDDQWPCAPKTFRFLERSLWSIGKEKSLGECKNVPGFLRCEDTWPDRNECAKWWSAFRVALRSWWNGERCAGTIGDQVSDLLGERTPVKQWLVRLYAHKLYILTQSGETIARLVDGNR